MSGSERPQPPTSFIAFIVLCIPSMAITRLKAFSAMRRRTEEELDDYTAAAIEDPADDPEVALDVEKRLSQRRALTAQLVAEGKLVRAVAPLPRIVHRRTHGSA